MRTFNIVGILKEKTIRKSNVQFNELFSQNGLVTFLNSYSYFQARDLIKLFKNFDYIFIDGFYMATILSILFGKKIQRRSFDMTSIAPILFKHSINEQKTIFFIGSTKEHLNLALKQFKVEYKELNIIGKHSGFFKNEFHKNEVIRIIIEKKPDYVIVGMGTPIQEEFLLDAWKRGWRGLGFTCGGFIHQTSKRLHYYPIIIDKLHLRWFYRLIKEPHTVKRFLTTYPIFPFILLKDYLQYKTK